MWRWWARKPKVDHDESKRALAESRAERPRAERAAASIQAERAGNHIAERFARAMEQGRR